MTAKPAEPSTTTQPSPTRLKTFLRRLLSSVILWAVVLGAMFSGNKVLSNTVFITIMLVLTGFGLAEFYDLAGKRALVCFRKWGVVGGVLLVFFTFLHFTGSLGISGTPARVNDFETSFLILFVLGLSVLQLYSRAPHCGLSAIATTLFGLMYVAWLLNFIQKINYFPGVEGPFYVLYFILVTKLSDTGAYVVGSLFGKHKMIPRISPGKTWEGFAGALIISALASLAYAHFARAHLAGMTMLHALVLGVTLGAAAVVGDLIESLFKREAGVKDSGRYFPGIGGILDLVDSLLFNAPLMYLYLRHVLTNPVLR
jgi:phosphatidate cytidylyltransferase